MNLYTLGCMCIAVTLVVAMPAHASHEGQPSGSTLGFYEAIDLAIKQDPWLVQSAHTEKALQAKSTASSSLPDPKLSIGINNLATDTLDFNQEPMTQFKVGFSQAFPAGDSLKIQSQKLQSLAAAHPFQREDRKAKLKVKVGQLWLDLYRAQESIRLIHDNRELFEQLVGVAESSYSTAMGRTRQHDVIRAQLELTRLDDRLTVLHQEYEQAKQYLGEWIDIGSITELPSQLPNISLQLSNNTQYDSFLEHPAVQAVNYKIEAQQYSIHYSKQKYKPAWGLSGSYGYRDDAPNGVERADFFSIGVTVDLPFFTALKQDQNVKSETHTLGAIKTEKQLLIRKLMAGHNASKSNLEKLRQRQKIYKNKLLPKMYQQAEASLTAYTNDDGDFSEVVRSRIAVLNAEIEALNINIFRLKETLHLVYYRTRSGVVGDEKGVTNHEN